MEKINNKLDKKNYPRLVRAAAILAGSIALMAGCGGHAGASAEGSSDDSAVVFEEVVVPKIESGGDKSYVTAEYLENGSRVLSFRHSNNDWAHTVVEQFCDGPYLMEISDNYREDAFDGSDIHDACADGRLTPEDFRLPG